MKKNTKTATELRKILIEYLDFLLTKQHIACRQTLAKYRVRLVLDEHLTSKELNTIIKFLVRDSAHTKSELRQIFKPIVNNTTKAELEPASLAGFLTHNEETSLYE